MTGKTHMAVSAATVSVVLAVLAAAEAGSAKGTPYLLSLEPGTLQPGVYTIAGLLFIGIVAGLFPDLDTPDTELQRLPHRTAEHLGRYLTASVPRGSPLAVLLQELVRVAVLPLTLILAAIGAGIRAFTGHRGFTHTVWGTLASTGLAAGATLLITGSAQWSLIVGVVWLLGYSSHLAADACTPSGIPLFMLSRSSAHATACQAVADHDRRRRIWQSEGGKRSNWHSQVSREDIPPGHAMYHSWHHSRPANFHLLPNQLRVRTGTMADTLVIRWAAWVICAGALTSMFMVRL